jgi:hypothetical protein
MATASDLTAFEHSVEPSTNEVPFNSKKWTYIQDSTSNTGQYAGQIQFNLSTISSQASFIGWEETIVQQPVKLQILNAGSTSITSTAAATIDQLIPKAGSWQFIDSVQVVIDGVTVQSNQIHENVNCTFKALTEWSEQDLLRQGSTSLMALDSYNPPLGGVQQNLGNIATSSHMNATIGEFGLANTYSNLGARERSLFTSLNQSSPTGATTLANDTVGGASNLQSEAKPLVWTAPAGSVAPGAPFYVAHFIVSIRLAEICDYFKKCPMQKNVKGFIYINYNSSVTNFTTGATAGVVSPANIASVNMNMNYGNTCPVLYNFSSFSSNVNGAPTGLAVPAGSALQITADINGTPTAGVPLTPSQTFSRLLVPTYSPNPSADQALTQKKTFRYFDRMTNKFTILPNQSFTVTITNGIANPRKLIMQPIITNPVFNSTTADVINPYRSPFC